MKGLLTTLLFTTASAAGAGPIYSPIIDGFRFRGWNVSCHALYSLHPGCSATRRLGDRCLSIGFSRNGADVGYHRDCGYPEDANSRALALPLEYRDERVSEAIAALVERLGNRSARHALDGDFAEDADTLAALLFRITDHSESIEGPPEPAGTSR
ncbi:MAG TPA: hypothetical protein VEW25_10545 [Allosphingosinicella sp.]|nr:hypothetical protein [Allosphingosinicella sp.]